MRKKISSWFLLIGLVFALTGCGAGGGGSTDNPAAGGADTTPPTVASKSPDDTASAVAINSNIIVTFSEAMDESTVNTTTFTVKDASNNAVAGTVTCSGTSATFTPSSSLAASTTFTVTIAAGVKDSAGNATASDSTWTFTTGTAGTAPSAPTGVTATAGNNQVAISWSAASSATTYTVYRATATGALSAKTAVTTGVTATNYTDTTAINGTAYYYQVTAVNSYGESGGSSEVSATPTSGGGTFTTTPMVKAGSNYTIALKSDGTVWGWGSNYQGELGDGTTTSRTTPVQVSGIAGVIAISEGGDEHTLALKSDGTVWAWGYNYSGQLGDGTTTNRTTPVQVSGLNLN